MYVQLFSGFSASSPSWDLFIFLFFIVSTFVYGFTLGRSRILLLLISTYMGLAVMKTLPFLTDPQLLSVDASPLFVARITAFLGMILLIFFFLSNSALRKGLSNKDVHGKPLQIILFSVLHAGLLVAAVLSFVPAESQAVLGLFTRQLFLGTFTFPFWIVGPILGMMFIRDEEE